MVEEISPNSLPLQDRMIIKTTTFENTKFKSNPRPTSGREPNLLINFNQKDQIPVNKSIVVERCPFFASMFGKHGFSEANSREINVTYDAEVPFFKSLINYIHTGEITLTTGNLVEVTRAAVYFQLSDLLKFCCSVLELNVSIDNVNYLYQIAFEYALDGTRRAAVDFEAEHFESIVKSRIFLDWTAEHMEELLSSDKIVVAHERKVLKFAFDWLKCDFPTREKNADNLMRHLRFTYLTTNNLKEAADASLNEQTLCETLYRVASELSDRTTNPRVYEKKGIYLLGAAAVDTTSFVFVRYSPVDGSVTPLKAPKHHAVCIAKLAVNNDDVFAVFLDENSDECCVLHIEKYDVRKDEWSPRKSKNLDLLKFEDEPYLSVCFCEGKLYAFVRLERNRPLAAEYFRYSADSDQWQSLPLKINGSEFYINDVRRTYSYGDCIYMPLIFAPSVQQFKPSTDEWTPILFDKLLMYWRELLVGYKRNIVIFPTRKLQNQLIVFNLDTIIYRYYHFTDLIPYGATFFTVTVFDDCIYVFVCKLNFGIIRLVKLDLSSLEELKEPTVHPLLYKEFQMLCCIDVVSMQ